MNKRGKNCLFISIQFLKQRIVFESGEKKSVKRNSDRHKFSSGYADGSEEREETNSGRIFAPSKKLNPILPLIEIEIESESVQLFR
jgi:hypothetical protein